MSSRQQQLRQAIRSGDRILAQQIVQNLVMKPPPRRPIQQIKEENNRTNLMGLCIQLPKILVKKLLPVLVSKGYDVNQPVSREKNGVLYTPYIVIKNNAFRQTQDDKLGILHFLETYNLNKKLLIDNGPYAMSRDPEVFTWCDRVNTEKYDEPPTSTYDVPLGNLVSAMRLRYFSVILLILENNPALLQTDEYHVGHVVVYKPVRTILRLLVEMNPGIGQEDWINVMRVVLASKKLGHLPIHFVSYCFNLFLRLHVPLDLYSYLLRTLTMRQRIAFLKDEMMFLGPEHGVQREYLLGVHQTLRNLINIETYRENLQQQSERQEIGEQVLWRRITQWLDNKNKQQQNGSKAYRIMKKIRTEPGLKPGSYDFYTGMGVMPQEIMTELRQYI